MFDRKNTVKSGDKEFTLSNPLFALSALDNLSVFSIYKVGTKGRWSQDRISQIPMHPTRMSESISINISGAGFEAMKNDPEYEAWVLNDLRTGWAQPDRWNSFCSCSQNHYPFPIWIAIQISICLILLLMGVICFLYEVL